MIDIYVFWDAHSNIFQYSFFTSLVPTESEFYWDDNLNLTQFVQLCGEHNLFVNLRIGPYVCGA